MSGKIYFTSTCSILTSIFIRHLAGEIAGEWAEKDVDDRDVEDKLIQLAKQIVPYNMAHNAEAEACDLLMEIERLDLLEQYVDENIYPRVCLYLTRYVLYLFNNYLLVLINTFSF